MNKKLSVVLLAVLCLFAGVTFSACGRATVKDIYVVQGTISTTVEQFSTLDYSDVVVMAKLSNGTEVEISAVDCKFSSINTQVLGEQTLTITYDAYSTTVTITVVKKLTAISVKAGSIATAVGHNGTLDTSNAVIVLSYSDGSSAEINASEPGLVIQQANTSTVGNGSITITYKGLSCTHSFSVNKVLTSITVTGTYSTKIPFKSTFVTSGITAVANYSNGDTANVGNSELSFSNLNTSDKQNIKTNNIVTVSYNNVHTTITVEIYAVLTSITYTSGLSANVKYNTDLNTSALVVTGHYNNDTQKPLTQNLTITGYNKQNLGAQTLTISYKDSSMASALTTQTQVTVYEELESLDVQPLSADPSIGYALVDQTLDTSKFKIVAVYSKNRVVLNDNSQEYAKVSFSAVDTSTVGDKTLTITYGTKQANVTVHVVASLSDISGLEMQSISIIDGSVANQVDHNHAYDISGLQILVTYTNSLTATLNYSDHQTGDDAIAITNINTSTVGNKTLSVSYQGKQCTKQVEVKRVLVSISIKANTAISSIKYGSTLDLSNVVILATYSNSTNDGEEVSNVTSNYSSFDNTNTSDAQLIVFSYSEDSVNSGRITKTCNMSVTVYDQIEELVDVQNVATTVEYGTTYNTSQITAKVRYTSGTQVSLSNSSLSFSTINTNTLGTQNLVISYQLNGKTVQKQYEVTVYDVVTSISIKSGVADSVYVGETLDVSGLVLTVTFKSGATQDITSGFNVTNISTTTEGQQTLYVSYEGKQTSKTIDVVKSFTVVGYSNPTLATSYLGRTQNTFTQTGSTGDKGFTDLTAEYVVGDDNAFVYQPILMVKYSDNSTQELTEFDADINVYIYNTATNSYTLLTTNLSQYVTVNSTTHTFTFTSSALTEKFKIEMLPANLSTEEANKISASVFEFRVVDGWNAYTAKDVSLIDNVNALEKWTTYKTQNNISLTANINAIILHNNISITDDDIPEEHFLTDADISQTDSDYESALGSLRDSLNGDLGLIYQRQIANGQTFTLHGNYFQLSVQDLSLIVRESVDGVLKINETGGGITTHTALFGFVGSTETSEVSSVVLNNVAFFGNTKKSDNATLSGGVLFCKAKTVSFTAYNNLSQCWFISYMIENNTDYAQQNTHITFNKVNCFDAYNTMLYIWSGYDVNILNSVMIGAGGPIMICDHVDNNESTGEGGYITNVKVTSSTLESYIAGTEGWFETYQGSGALVGMIKAMDALIKPYRNTLLDSSGNKVNLIAIYKSGSAQGLTTSAIRGSFVDTNQEKFTNGLDLSSTAIASTKQQIIKTLADQGMSSAEIQTALGQMAILQTFNGAVGVPGTSNWLVTPDQTTFESAEKYLGVYLFNGMGAVLGLNQLSA